MPELLGSCWKILYRIRNFHKWHFSQLELCLSKFSCLDHIRNVTAANKLVETLQRVLKYNVYNIWSSILGSERTILQKKFYFIRNPQNLVLIFHQCFCAPCDCKVYEYTPHKFKIQICFTNFSAEKLSSQQLPLISTLCADSWN